MRFLVMHKVDANMEAAAPPSREIIEGMGQLVQGSLRDGTFTNGAGLHRSAQRIRLRFSPENRQFVRGPYEGENELIARFAMVSVPSMKEAVEQAERYADVLGEGEIEIGPVVEPWDLGLVPKPSRIERSRFLLLIKSNDRFEGKVPFDPLTVEDMAEVEKAMTEEGVLLAAERFAPSARASRLSSGPKRTWVDGPFAESKELIAGFSLLKLPTRDDARAWAERYAAILGDNEVDVLLVLEPGE
jgi:hypothetical protein